MWILLKGGRTKTYAIAHVGFPAEVRNGNHHVLICHIKSPHIPTMGISVQKPVRHVGETQQDRGHDRGPYSWHRTQKLTPNTEADTGGVA